MLFKLFQESIRPQDRSQKYIYIIFTILSFDKTGNIIVILHIICKIKYNTGNIFEQIMIEEVIYYDC